MACPNRQQHILDRAERVPLATTWKADHVVIAGEPGSHGRDALLRDPALHVSTPFRFYPANPRAVREMLAFSCLSQNSEVWILVLVVVVDQSEAFSPAKRARLSRNYFVQLV
ncbi:MAG TPA: hypothetical protein VGX93_05530 [Chthoniobacterales bacterium]|nr:hypothetical protein [Chthoniobacterales bacterium]